MLYQKAELVYFELKDKVLKVTATPTAYLTSRSTVLSLTYKTLRRDISVSQAASTGSDDIKIEVASATATTEETEQEDRGIEKSFDGDYSSYFNSKFGAFSDWPFIIDIHSNLLPSWIILSTPLEQTMAHAMELSTSSMSMS